MGARYVVTGASDQVVSAEILEDIGGTARVRLTWPDGATKVVEIHLDPVGAGRWLSASGGHHALVDAVAPVSGSWAILHGASAFELTVQDERDTWLSGGGDGGGAARVTVAMPGKVVAVDTTVGAVVTKGQRLLVIEAMKMENDVKSPRDGVVKAVLCKVGDAVEGGATLVELE